jgi:aryl-alcohol dehydrogenase-like predicted oxidoreductase
MEYVNLGRSGLRVSRICLGMMGFGDPNWRPWILSEEQARPILSAALERGINFFDTADMYSEGQSEALTGKLLLEMVPRDQVVIATKVFMPTGDGPNQRGLSRAHIMHAIDGSLKRLGTDYVDLYQIHRFDPATPIEETLEALNDVVRAGKARYVGASSMKAWQFAKYLHTAESRGWPRFISMQNYLNLVYREEEREMLPLCRDQGIGIIPFSPLARGFLAGNRSPGGEARTIRAKNDRRAHEMLGEDNDYEILGQVTAIADELGVTSAQVALAWLLHKPGVTAPVVGSSKVEHLKQAIKALDVQLTGDHLVRLESCYLPRGEIDFSEPNDPADDGR